jgi:hypothetical protein
LFRHIPGTSDERLKSTDELRIRDIGKMTRIGRYAGIEDTVDVGEDNAHGDGGGYLFDPPDRSSSSTLALYPVEAPASAGLLCAAGEPKALARVLVA